MVADGNGSYYGKEGRRVIAEYQKKSNIWVGVGFAIEVVGRVMLMSSGSAGS